jgi:hypothetical protein
LRFAGGITQHSPQGRDSHVDRVVKVYGSVIRPKRSLDFIASGDTSLGLDKHLQNAEGLLLQDDLLAPSAIARFPKLSAAKVELKVAETYSTGLT